MLGQIAQDEDPIPEQDEIGDHMPFDEEQPNNQAQNAPQHQQVNQEDAELILEIPQQHHEPQISLSIAGSTSFESDNAALHASSKDNMDVDLPIDNPRSAAQLLGGLDLNIPVFGSEIMNETALAIPDNNRNFDLNAVTEEQQEDAEPMMPNINLQLIIGPELQANQDHNTTAAPSNTNLHVGFVELIDDGEADPGLMAFYATQSPNHFKIGAECYRLWAKHFSDKENHTTVSIPANWVTFLTSMLTKPSHFGSAKNLLYSQAWEFIQSCGKGESLLFSLPVTCHEKAETQCHIEKLSDSSPSIIHEDNQADLEVFDAPGLGKELETEQAIDITPSRAKVIDTDFRRSDRLKGKSKGYKQGTCGDKYCISCSTEPPTVPTSVIKNLGTLFCKLPPEEVTNEALQKKRKAKGTIKKDKDSDKEQAKKKKPKASIGAVSKPKKKDDGKKK